jgi:hypothetical protein
VNDRRGRRTALIADASAGIGAIYAHRLARRGFRLALAGSCTRGLGRFARWLRAYGASVETLALDASEGRVAERIADRIARDRDIAFVVNNSAGADLRSFPFEPDDHVEAMMALNGAPAARLAYAAAAALAARGGGTIVNVAAGSLAGPDRFDLVGQRPETFLAALSRLIELELGDSGVRAQAVIPAAGASMLWAMAEGPVERLPRELAGMAEAIVDDALAGLDEGDLVTRLTLRAFDGLLAERLRNPCRIEPSRLPRAA